MQKEQEVDIYGLAYGGSGVGKLDGKVCFVEGALPGEKVRFVVSSEKKRFTSGLTTEIISASRDRTKPECQYYGKCGGCQYQHLNYGKEVFYKGEQVKEILRRIGGFHELNIEEIVPSALHYGYRSSITLHKSKAGYGYFSYDNKTVIPIDRCPLASDTINSAIPNLDVSGGKEDVTIKSDKSGKAWISGHPGHRFFKDDFLGKELTFSPIAFSQTNRHVAESMIKRLRFLMKETGGVLFDLYCGAGFFGILMHDLFESIVGIDGNRVAINCAKSSKADLSIKNIKFYLGEVDTSFNFYYDRMRGEKNTILIDPPRSGISKRLAARLAALNGVSLICYISCDPAMLARDAKILTQGKAWSLDKVTCFDMFPRTKHIETIAFFKKCD